MGQDQFDVPRNEQLQFPSRYIFRNMKAPANIVPCCRLELSITELLASFVFRRMSFVERRFEGSIVVKDVWF